MWKIHHHTTEFEESAIPSVGTNVTAEALWIFSCTNRIFFSTQNQTMSNEPQQQPSDPAVLDPTEVALGISSYLRPDVQGFSAVSKGRFSDFLVHESKQQPTRLTTLPFCAPNSDILFPMYALYSRY
jgi:hypothetical protein